MIYHIPQHTIRDNPWQVRTEYDEERIEELARDIARVGLLHTPVGRLLTTSGPIVPLDEAELRARLDGGCMVELACGHCRLRALKRLHIDRSSVPTDLFVPVELRELSDDRMAQIAWSENAARKDITAWEEVEALRARTEGLGWTHKECAEKLGLARVTVTNKLRILALPKKALAAFREGEITERQAMALLAVYGEDEELLEAIRENCFVTPPQLLKDARAGLSSEEIRRRWDACRSEAKNILTRAEKSSEKGGDLYARAEAERRAETEGPLARWVRETPIGRRSQLAMESLARLMLDSLSYYYGADLAIDLIEADPSASPAALRLIGRLLRRPAPDEETRLLTELVSSSSPAELARLLHLLEIDDCLYTYSQHGFEIPEHIAKLIGVGAQASEIEA